MTELTGGVIPGMFQKQYDIKRGYPILQVTAVREIKVRDTNAGETTPNQRRLKLSDGVVENQSCMYTGNEPQPNMKQYCSIKVLEYSIHTADPINNPDKSILQVAKLEVVKTSEQNGNTKVGNPQAWKNDGKSAIKVEKENRNAGNAGRGKPKPNLPSGQDRFVAIASLTPYMNKWTIKARVTQKGDMRTWNNAKGTGNLFSFTVIDESCDLKVTAFKEDATKFFEIIKVGECFTISNGVLKNKNAQYNNTGSDYELTLGRTSIIEPCDGDDEDLDGMPRQIYDFVPINKMESFTIEERGRRIVDVCGIIKSADNETTTLTSKTTGKDMYKRELIIVDNTKTQISLTLWGDNAQNFDQSKYVGEIIAVKGAQLGTFNGRSLSASFNSIIEFQIDQNGDEYAQKLMNWYNEEGNSESFKTITSGGGASGGSNTEWKLLNNINADCQSAGKPIYFNSKCTVTYVKKDNPAYRGCPGKEGSDTKCNKKLMDEGNGNYRCEKCDFHTPTFNWRLILNAQIADDTGAVYTTFFGEQGEQLLDLNAQDFGALLEDKEGSSEKAYEKAISGPIFKEFILNNRATVDTYQDEQRVRIASTRLAEVNYANYAEKLLEEATQKYGITL